MISSHALLSTARRISLLQPGDDICCLYRDETQHRASLVPLIRGGLQRNEQIIYIADKENCALLPELLRDPNEPPVESFLRTGQLEVRRVEDFYLRRGRVDLDDLFALLRQCVATALAKGFTGLRVIGEMTWLLEEADPAALVVEYEKKVNEFLRNAKCVTICRFDRRKFSPSLLLDVLAIHAILFLGSQLVDNVNYIAPKELARRKGEATRLDEWIDYLLAQKRSQEALQESENKNRAILSKSIIGSYTVDRQGRLLYANEAYCQMVGYSLAELTTMRLADLEALESPADVANHITKVLIAGSDRFETKHRHKSGRFIDIEISVNTDSSFQDILFIFARDISQQKQAEASLLESEERYRVVTENSAEAIYQFDRESRFIFVNRAGARMVGYEVKELNHAHISMLVYPARLAEIDAVSKKVLSGHKAEGEIMLKHKDGHEFPVRYSISPLHNSAGIIGSTGIAHDITDRRREEAERLKKNLAEKELLLREIHHRVKNNMQIISSLLYLQSLKTQNPEALAMIHNSMDRVRTMALIHEKLYGQGDLARIDFDGYIRTLTKYLADTYAGATGPVTFEIHAPGIFLPVDTAIPCGLIINELVSNSLKYAFQGHQGGTVHISLTRSNDDGSLVLRVADDGCGFPATHDPEKLTTLGLNLVNRLASQLDGTLEVRSDRGVEYILRIPCAIAPVAGRECDG